MLKTKTINKKNPNYFDWGMNCAVLNFSEKEAETTIRLAGVQATDFDNFFKGYFYGVELNDQLLHKPDSTENKTSTSFDSNSSDFYHQWGRECALNSLSTTALDQTIVSLLELTEQNKLDIYRGYNDNKIFKTPDKNLTEVNIFFRDLNPSTQKEICRIFKTTPEEENWDTIPLTTINRDQ